MSSRSDRNEADAADRDAANSDRRAAQSDRDAAVTDRGAAVSDRSAAADDRTAAAEDRSAAADDRTASTEARKSVIEEVEALQQELAATNVLLVGLSSELAASRAETAVRVEGLRAEQQRERRVRMMAVSGGVLGVISAYDQHVEHCSPGSRVVHAVDHLITHPAKPTDTPVIRQQDFEHVYDHASIWCDVTMPLHTHDGSGWPSGGDLIGLGILGSIALVVAVYHRYRTIQDFDRVGKAAQKEEEHARP